MPKFLDRITWYNDDGTEKELNVESGSGAGSVQQVKNGSYTSAVASGAQSAAFGGLRYDTGSAGGEARSQTSAEGEQSFAAGGGAHAHGRYSASFGKDNHSYQRSSFTEGSGNKAGMTQSDWTSRYGSSSANDPWGDSYTESYSDAHAEGEMTEATGRASHAEGFQTEAYGHHAHAEGYQTSATAESAHSEGRDTEASGNYSHAGGLSSKASGQYSYAAGYGSNAQNEGAFCHGLSCFSNANWQTVFGQYNELESNALFVIGNGTSSLRENALSLKSNGILWTSGGFRTDEGTALLDLEAMYTLESSSWGSRTLSNSSKSIHYPKVSEASVANFIAQISASGTSWNVHRRVPIRLVYTGTQGNNSGGPQDDYATFLLSCDCHTYYTPGGSLQVRYTFWCGNIMLIGEVDPVNGSSSGSDFIVSASEIAFVE